jgi:two-component system chemotaxis response regulator CheB
LLELTKLRVVVVDDSAFIRQVIRNALMRESDMHVVGWACDGLEALEEIVRLAPDVITLDCEMPRCDGEAVLATLRGLAVRPAVVMVTGLDVDAAQLLAEGAASVIAKGASGTLDMARLVHAVRSAGNDARGRRGPSRAL